MEINIEEKISTTKETIKTNDESKNKLLSQDEEIDKNLIIINKIRNILEMNKTNKQKEEIAYEEILVYIKKEKIDLKNVRDSGNYTIIQRFCLDKEDYYLSCILIYFEKELDENSFYEYLIINDNFSRMNLFELSSEICELKIFRILKKYLVNNIKLLEHLINKNIDGKKNIFHIAAEKNKIMSLLFFYSFYYNNNIHNSILNIKDKSALTPLHIACNYGNYEFVQYLINLGANIDCLDKDNKTPLFYAVQSNNIKIIKYLIINGADKYIKDTKGLIAIDYTLNSNILDILENKSWYDIICKCKTQFINIKNNHRNIVMVVLLIFMLLFHCYIIIKYKLSNFIINCNYNIKVNFDFIILVINIIFECFAFLLYILFQFIKTKKEINSNFNYENKFCLKENGIEYYEMFKYNENLCVKCKRVKEMNTKHCIACDVCIDEFDHHCFFLNACISKNNIKYFRIFLFEIFSTLIFNLILSIDFFIDLLKEPKIYYGFIFNTCNFHEGNYKFIDYIIYVIDIIYFLFCLFTILISAIPFIVNLIKKKKLRTSNNNILKERINTPLFPIEGNVV